MKDQMKSSWYILYNEKNSVYTLSTDTFRSEQVDKFCTDKGLTERFMSTFLMVNALLLKKNRWDIQVDPMRI